MHGTSQQIRDIIFFVLVLIFALLVALFNLDGRFIRLPISLLVGLVIAFALLGLAVIVLTVRLKEARAKKIFFLLAGASAAAMPLCVLLHNVVYALFIAWYSSSRQSLFARHCSWSEP
jgi:hypothetical protein